MLLVALADHLIRLARPVNMSKHIIKVGMIYTFLGFFLGCIVSYSFFTNKFEKLMLEAEASSLLGDVSLHRQWMCSDKLSAENDSIDFMKLNLLALNIVNISSDADPLVKKSIDYSSFVVNGGDSCQLSFEID